jgi:hypothetical protein
MTQEIPTRYFVAVLDDHVDGAEQNYMLATKRLFATEHDAKQYAATCAPTRKPIVVEASRHAHLVDALVASLRDAIQLLTVYTAPAGTTGPNATTRGQAESAIGVARAILAKAEGR